MVIQGRIHDSLMEVHVDKGGFDLLILPDYSLLFPDFVKNHRENEIILSQRGFEQTT